MKRPVTIREEVNALTCWAVRHGYLEELHAGKYSELLETPGLSRLNDAEMKKLIIGIATSVAEILTIKETNPVGYWNQIKYLLKNYCQHWEK
jgi:hypothetical protein